MDYKKRAKKLFIMTVVAGIILATDAFLVHYFSCGMYCCAGNYPGFYCFFQTLSIPLFIFGPLVFASILGLFIYNLIRYFISKNKNGSTEIK